MHTFFKRCKKTGLKSLCPLVLCLPYMFPAHAALLDNAVLYFDPGIPDCTLGGTYPNCDSGIINVPNGSFFKLDTNPVAIAPFEGIILGQAQPSSPGHWNPPDGTESPGIDLPWNFFDSTGMHFTVNNGVTIVSDDGTGNVILDFSNWHMSWDVNLSINLGSYAHSGGIDGQAVMSCGNSCEISDRFTLDYYAAIPPGDPSGLGLIPYTLHLEGTILPSLVPLPAAVWLLGFGLLGLMGIARRHQKQVAV